MKIVHVQQYFNQGYGYQENILPRYQKLLGNDVLLITSTRSDGHNGEDRKKSPGSFIENDFEVRRIPIMAEFRHRFVIFKNLYRVLLDEKPEYIYHHSATSPSLFSIYKYKRKYPETHIVVDNHADLQISGRNKIWKVFYYNLIWKTINKFIEKKIDIYFGVTPDRCVFLIDELGISKEKVKLLPIGADTERIKREDKHREELITKYKIPSDSLIFCHGGKMSVDKKTDKLIDAFKLLENDNARLILFGTFIDQELEESLNSDKRIIYLGWCDRFQVMEILSGSDVGVWNGQHTTLLEDAIACELPLILQKYGSTSHLIESNGIFISNSGIANTLSAMEKMQEKDILSECSHGAKKMRDKLSYYSIAKKSLEI